MFSFPYKSVSSVVDPLKAKCWDHQCFPNSKYSVSVGLTCTCQHLNTLRCQVKQRWSMCLLSRLWRVIWEQTEQTGCLYSDDTCRHTGCLYSEVTCIQTIKNATLKWLRNNSHLMWVQIEHGGGPQPLSVTGCQSGVHRDTVQLCSCYDITGTLLHLHIDLIGP